MEPHRELGPEALSYKPDEKDGLYAYFKKSLEFTKRFYGEEVKRISRVNFSEVTPEFVFKEYVWVVHATGFSAKAVGKFMPRLLEAYGEWDVLGREEFDYAFNRILKVCNNRQKSKAIHEFSGMLVRNKDSWESFLNSSMSSPEKLSKLPYIGKITCYHLGRNIGLLECVKPDLHLERLARYWGVSSCLEMCEQAQSEHMKETGIRIPLGLVDLMYWYGSSHFGTLHLKEEGRR